jgi:hypothetical protein
VLMKKILCVMIFCGLQLGMRQNRVSYYRAAHPFREHAEEKGRPAPSSPSAVNQSS